MSTSTFTVRKAPEGTPVARVDFPVDMEGHGVAHYAITQKPALRRGGAPRFLVYLVLDADGLCLNDNLPVDCKPTAEQAIARAKAEF